MIYLIGPILYALSTVERRLNSLILPAVMLSASIYLTFALNEIPQGGDFNSLILRSKLIETFDLGTFFTWMVHISTFFNLNVSSFYAFISIILLIFTAFRFQKYYIFYAPFTYFLIITGYQRQGLGLILITLAYLYFADRKKFIAVVLTLLGISSHPTLILPVVVFAWCILSSNWHFLFRFAPLLGFFLLEDIAEFHPVLDHMVEFYLLSDATSDGALPRISLIILLLALVRSSFNKIEKQYTDFTLLYCLYFFAIGATTIADRFSILLLLITSLQLGDVSPFKRICAISLVTFVALAWITFSSQYKYNWSPF